MTVLEDIHTSLEAQNALLVNLQDDQEKLVTLVTELKAQVEGGAQVTPAQLEEVLQKLNLQKSQLEQLNLTQDQALAAGETDEGEVEE